MKIQIIPMLLIAMAISCESARCQTNQAPVQDPVVIPSVAPAPVEPPAPLETNAVAALAAAPAAASTAAPAALPTNSEEQPILINPAATLPEAVQVLARAAGINFLFDPKLLNQVGPNGLPVPPPLIGVEIRWEKVTPAQALTALLENYGWQMTMDPKTKIYRIGAKDPAALEPLITSVIQLKYSNPTNMQAQLTQVAGRLSNRSLIIPDLRTGQLIVMTTEKELSAVEELIHKLDHATKQVLIEAKILETTKNPKSARGVDWSGTLSEQQLTYGNGTRTSQKVATTGSATKTTVTDANKGDGAINSAGSFTPDMAFLSASGVSAMLDFLNTDAETESLSLPRTVAQDGVQTELAVVRNVPIFEQDQSGATGNSGAVSSAKPVYDKKVEETLLSEVGTKLKVTPRIVGQTNVFLTLNPEISSEEIAFSRVVLNGQVCEAPIFSRRKITTQATVPSGSTLVLGGLTSDSTAKTFTKVPFLGDIPGLGLLFRHDSKERTKQNLLIFVTPTIIQDSDFQLTKTDFLKTKFAPPEDKDESPLDTGKPKDWTKPKKTAPANDLSVSN